MTLSYLCTCHAAHPRQGHPRDHTGHLHRHPLQLIALAVEVERAKEQEVDVEQEGAREMEEAGEMVLREKLKNFEFPAKLNLKCFTFSLLNSLYSAISIAYFFLSNSSPFSWSLLFNSIISFLRQGLG